ncbi:MAG: hypothetical protein ABSF74_03470 [Dehalococcoidia bacterium]
MRSLIILFMAVLIIAVVGGCQVAYGGTPVTVSYDKSDGNVIALKITQPQDESIVRSTPLSVSGTVTSPAEITVNGISVDVKDNHFNTLIDLERGPNPIDISARDVSGHETSKNISVVYVP